MTLPLLLVKPSNCNSISFVTEGNKVFHVVLTWPSVQYLVCHTRSSSPWSYCSHDHRESRHFSYSTQVADIIKTYVCRYRMSQNFGTTKVPCFRIKNRKNWCRILNYQCNSYQLFSCYCVRISKLFKNAVSIADAKFHIMYICPHVIYYLII